MHTVIAVVSALLALVILPAESASAEELQLRRSEAWRGRQTLHYTQLHRGVPVRGAGRSVHLQADGSVGLTFGEAHPGLTVDVVPSLDRDDAALRVQALLNDRAPDVVAPELVVLARGAGVLAWQTRVRTHRPDGLWYVAIDAHSGETRALVDLRHTVTGRVYRQHPKAGDPVFVTLTQLLPLPNLGGNVGGFPRVHLSGVRAAVASLKFLPDGTPTAFPYAQPNAGGNYVFEPDAASDSDAFAEVHAYYHITRAAQWFSDRFGFFQVTPADIIVNYREAPGQDYLNAFAFREPLTGQFVIRAGQADGVDMAYDAMILVHEFGHPIFDLRTDINENNLYPINADERGFHPAPHALNEGYSDYWAATYFDEPDVFEVIGDSDIAPRHLVNDFRCPEDVWGEAHLDAPLVSSTLWEVRSMLGPDVTDQLAYDLLARLSASPTFEEFGFLISDAVVALVDDGVVSEQQRLAVDVMLDRRGLFNCDRTVDIADGEPRLARMPGADTLKAAIGLPGELCGGLRVFDMQIPLAFSYRFVAPEDGVPIEGLRVRLAFAAAGDEPLEDDDLQYQLVIRKDEPVGLEILSLPFQGQVFQLPIRAQDFDAQAGDEPTDVTFGPDALPITPGASYHLNVLALNCPTTELTLQIDWLRPTPEQPIPDPVPVDPGPDTIAADDGGCAGGGLGLNGAWALCLVFGAWASRRRR